jgi:hypothetical protein
VNAVLSAYETLAAEGLIHGKTGLGTRVTGSVRPLKPRELQFLVRNSHYPADPVPLTIPMCNLTCFHR